jgi:Methyltransferase domain
MSDWRPEIFRDDRWQMSFGERAAIEGVLAQLEPSLAIELGTAEGGSLARIAAHSSTVHAIDLASPPGDLPSNVQLHVGDSRELLPRLLRELAADDRNVEFVLVDGDHSAEGVRTDLVNLLGSPALARTIVLIHDTMNPTVRAGVDAARIDSRSNVAHFEPDFIPGYMVRTGPYAGELWGGLGLVAVEAGARPESVRDPGRHDAYATVRELGGTVRSARGHGAILGRARRAVRLARSRIGDR